MDVSNEQSYMEMIHALQLYKAQVTQTCGVMLKAADDCLDNTMGDASAVKTAKQLSACCKKIQPQLEEVERIAKDLTRELEELRRTTKNEES